jgi:hypothetical protein
MESSTEILSSNLAKQRTDKDELRVKESNADSCMRPPMLTRSLPKTETLELNFARLRIETLLPIDRKSWQEIPLCVRTNVPRTDNVLPRVTPSIRLHAAEDAARPSTDTLDESFAVERMLHIDPQVTKLSTLIFPQNRVNERIENEDPIVALHNTDALERLPAATHP